METLEAAHEAGLDFAAITDHNTISLDDTRLAQGRYPHTLLIPGMEVTTFYGHANAIGVTDFVDFQLGSPACPRSASSSTGARRTGAPSSRSTIHPCPPAKSAWSCGWTAKDTDWSRVTAIEVINGSTLHRRRQGPPPASASGTIS